jgi:hypothetical protein
MKLNKKTIIPIIFFSTLSILAFGFVEKVIHKAKTENVSKKTYETKKNTFTSKKSILFNPQEAILGVWLRENDSTDKLEFTADGHIKRYFDNVLQYDDLYLISNECDGNISQTDHLYLTTIDGEDGSESCETIMNGVYEPNSTTLTLLDDNGRLVIYNRP